MVTGRGRPEPVPTAQGLRRNLLLVRMPFYHRVHSQTCAHTFGWDSVDAPVHPMCTALGWGRKLESPEKTHTDMARVGQLHTHSSPGWESVIFPHQYYHDTMLLEDPIRPADPRVLSRPIALQGFLMLCEV